MITRRALFPLAFAASLAAGATQAQQGPNTLLNVSYDVGRELFAAENALFIPLWKEKTGQELTISQSHAGTSAQARAIIEGLPADVVTFNQTLDVDTLAKAGYVAKDWKSKPELQTWMDGLVDSSKK